MLVNNGGYYTKHVYIGSQRIVSKLASSDIFNVSPVNTSDLKLKYTQLTSKIKERYDSLGVNYKGTEVTGGTGLISKTPLGAGGLYYYHSDHLGSSSLISDAVGGLVQHLEYMPFGEVFLDERASLWSTRYRFNAKELDEETGLYYYGARYLDPRLSIWLSVDPLALKYPGVSSYVYCLNNPLKFIDPDGRVLKLAGNSQERITVLTYLQKLTNDKLGVRQDGTVINMKTGARNTDKSLTTGTSLISDIMKSSKEMTISIGKKGSSNYETHNNSKNAKNGKGTDVKVNFDPSANPAIPTKDPKTGKVSRESRPNEIGLAHEMTHGDRSMEGKATDYSIYDSHSYKNTNGNTVIQTERKEELETVGLKGNNSHNENNIRKEQGLKQRGAY